MKLEVVKQKIKANTRTLKAKWTIVFEDDMNDKKMTWRDDLRRFRGSAFMGRERDSMESATKHMKAKYPGNYIVEEYFNSGSLSWDLRLKFDTPEDETWFLISNE